MHSIWSICLHSAWNPASNSDLLWMPLALHELNEKDLMINLLHFHLFFHFSCVKCDAIVTSICQCAHSTNPLVWGKLNIYIYCTRNKKVYLLWAEMNHLSWNWQSDGMMKKTQQRKWMRRRGRAAKKTKEKKYVNLIILMLKYLRKLSCLHWKRFIAFNAQFGIGNASMCKNWMLSKRQRQSSERAKEEASLLPYSHSIKWDAENRNGLYVHEREHDTDR